MKKLPIHTNAAEPQILIFSHDLRLRGNTAFSTFGCGFAALG
jgi:hypothetical protein